MPLKAVFFDAAGTLIKTAKPVGESYAQLAKQYGIEVPAEEIRERFRSCFASAPALAFPGAEPAQIKGLERQWWKDLVRRIFEPYGPFAQFEGYFSELFRYFGRAEAWTLYPDTLETLSLLRERGLILDVVSNFDSRLLAILDGLGIASGFDSVVISSHVGYAKPAAEIFQAALGLHGLKAEEALHVGDSLNNDAAGASGAGLTAVLLDRGGKNDSVPFPRARSLSEIVSLIEKINGPSQKR